MNLKKMAQRRFSENLFPLGCVALGLVTALSLAACQQDPFAEKSEAIKQGVAPELDLPPPAPKPVPSDALRITSDSDVYAFRELEAGEISVSGRVLQGAPDFKLMLENADEFPGSSFDATSGVFKWTPPRDTTGTEYGAPKILRIRLEATPVAGGAKLGTTKSILLYVTRSEVDPQIGDVENLVTIPTREGEFRKFTVKVTDPDSSDEDGKRPRLLAMPSVRGAADIAGLVFMDEPTAAAPNPTFDLVTKQWTFRMMLDLRAAPNQRGRDFTNRIGDFKFALQVISRYGRVGIKTVDAKILTDVLKPQVTWGEDIKIVAGVENTIQFTAFDPYAEGKVTVDFITRIDHLPGNGVASCEDNATREGDVICTISYKPAPTTTELTHEFKFKVTNTSRADRDTKSVSVPFVGILKVLPGQAPQPSPTPATPAVQTSSLKAKRS